MMYGVFDARDRVWFGTDDGPAVFEEKDLAMLARSVIVLRTGFPGKRVQVRPYDVTGPLHMKDKVPTVMDFKTAYKWLDGTG